MGIIDNILTINAGINASLKPVVGFGEVLIMLDTSSDAGVGLGYGAYKAQTLTSDLSASLAGYTAAASIFAAIRGAQRKPARVVFAGYDGSGSNIAANFNTAIAAMKAGGQTLPYWVGLDSRDAADIGALAAAANTTLVHGCIVVAQQSEGYTQADLFDTGKPFEHLKDASHKLLIYNSTDTKRLDIDCIAFQAAGNTDTTATGGHWYMGSGVSGDTTPSDSDVDTARLIGVAIGDTLYGAPAGASRARVYEMYTRALEPLWQRVTVDFVSMQIRTAIADIVSRHISAGSRFPGDYEGKNVLMGMLGTTLGALTGTGQAAWLAPNPDFDGRSWDADITWDAATRTFSGFVSIMMRNQVAHIDLHAAFQTIGDI